MKCRHVRELLSEYHAGELAREQAEAVRRHLAACAACRAESEGLCGVLQALDAAPAPPVRVDAGRLYRESADRQAQAARRWRRGCLAATAVAALALLALGLRLHIQVGPGRVVIGWGPTAVPPPEAEPAARPSVPPPPAPRPEVTAEEMELARELIHALAAEVERVDREQGRELQSLRDRVARLQLVSERWWQFTAQQLTALESRGEGVLEPKGGKP